MPVSAPAGDKKVLRASVLHYDPEPSSNDVQDAAEPFPEGTARVMMLRRLARATQAPTAPWVDLDLALHAAVALDLSGVPRGWELGAAQLSYRPRLLRAPPAALADSAKRWHRCTMGIAAAGSLQVIETWTPYSPTAGAKLPQPLELMLTVFAAPDLRSFEDAKREQTRAALAQ